MDKAPYGSSALHGGVQGFLFCLFKVWMVC